MRSGRAATIAADAQHHGPDDTSRRRPACRRVPCRRAPGRPPATDADQGPGVGDRGERRCAEADAPPDLVAPLVDHRPATSGRGADVEHGGAGDAMGVGRDHLPRDGVRAVVESRRQGDHDRLVDASGAPAETTLASSSRTAAEPPVSDTCSLKRSTTSAGGVSTICAVGGDVSSSSAWARRAQPDRRQHDDRQRGEQVPDVRWRRSAQRRRLRATPPSPTPVSPATSPATARPLVVLASSSPSVIARCRRSRLLISASGASTTTMLGAGVELLHPDRRRGPRSRRSCPHAHHSVVRHRR